MGAITTAFKKQYADTLYLLVQQEGSKLMNAVRYETDLKGEAKFYDQYGEDEANEKTSRHEDISYAADDYYRRMVTPTLSYWSKLIDSEDQISMVLDPKSTLMEAGKNAIGRKIDDKIIAALRGTAYTGTTGSTSTTLPSAQKVAAGGAGLTLAKLLSAKKIFDNADVPMEDRYIAITGTQLYDLLNTTEVKSADYNTVKALVQGEVNTFCGFKFILSNRLASLSTTRYVMAWHRSGILLASAGSMSTDVDRVKTKIGMPWQIYADIYCGSTRLEEEKVVEISCVES